MKWFRLFFYLTSCLKSSLVFSMSLISLSFSFSVWMRPGHPYSTLFPSPSVAAVASSCLRPARNGCLPRIRHGAGIYQATELRNSDKSDMCEHASFSVWFLCLFLRLWNALSLLIPTQFPFPLSFSRKSCGAHKRGWQCWTAAVGQLCSFMCNLPSLFFFFFLAARLGISLICNYFLLDQFIYV